MPDVCLPYADKAKADELPRFQVASSYSLLDAVDRERVHERFRHIGSSYAILYTCTHSPTTHPP